MFRKSVGTAVVLLSAMVYCSFNSAMAAPGGSSPATEKPRAFRSCTGLVQYSQRNYNEIVRPRKLVDPGRGSLAPPPPPPMPEPAAGTQGVPMVAAGAPMQQKAAAVEAPEHSQTNVQEPGVDEPDIVKTNGSWLFALTPGSLQAVGLQGDRPRLVGSLPIKDGQESDLLLRGDRLLVITNGYDAPRAEREAMADAERVTIKEVDVSDPARMRVLQSLTVEGSYLTARRNGEAVRVVINSHSQHAGRVGVLSATSAAVPKRRLGRWLPTLKFRNHRTGRSLTRFAVRCGSVRRAPAFSGLAMLTVLTIDMDKGLRPVDSDALMTSADTVYATKDSLYLASEYWQPRDWAQRKAAPPTTLIHKFDISDPGRTSYRASGEVIGNLLNQFAMSEHRGYLRVASTGDWTIDGQGNPQPQQSYVSVLADRDGKLDQVGQVGGLGRRERIYAVRFIDDVGYVVTFRRVDPLYTVNLSTPTDPKVAGELKIMGYSAYLHPAGKGRLIGVGQDATEWGGTTGTQLSLFDVSDLRHPVRLSQRRIGSGASSEAENDHHAFLYWAPTKLAVLPVEKYGNRDGGSFSGAIGFTFGDRDIKEAGRIRHQADHEHDYLYDTSIRRTLVAGGRIFSVSNVGVQASSLQNLTKLAWVPFEGAS